MVFQSNTFLLYIWTQWLKILYYYFDIKICDFYQIIVFNRRILYKLLEKIFRLNNRILNFRELFKFYCCYKTLQEIVYLFIFRIKAIRHYTISTLIIILPKSNFQFALQNALMRTYVGFMEQLGTVGTTILLSAKLFENTIININ